MAILRTYGSQASDVSSKCFIDKTFKQAKPRSRIQNEFDWFNGDCLESRNSDKNVKQKRWGSAVPSEEQLSLI